MAKKGVVHLPSSIICVLDVLDIQEGLGSL